MSQEPNNEPTSTASDGTSPQPDNAPRKRPNWALIALGFFGWWIVNGLYWVLLLDRQTLWQYAGDNFLILAPTFCLNLLALILLSIFKPTRKIGFGILAAIAVNLAIATILGVVENAWCFYPFFANQ